MLLKPIEWYGPVMAKQGQPRMSDDTNQPIDPTYRISNLRAAKQGVISVLWDDDLSVATTGMRAHDYSQLVVTNGPRNVKGVISWKAIAQRFLSHGGATKVRECTEEPQQVNLHEPLLNAMLKIADHDYVLVKSKQNPMCGIVTASDLSLEFQKLTEPFLLLGEIERHIREILGCHLSAQDIKDVGETMPTDRLISDVRDLTIGELVRIVERPDCWNKLALRNVDQKTFVSHLKKVRDLRNKVMHFKTGNANGEISADIKLLRNFAGFARNIYGIGSTGQ